MFEQQVLWTMQDVGGKEIRVKFLIILRNCTIIFIYLVFLLKIVPCFHAISEMVKQLCSFCRTITPIVPQASFWGVPGEVAGASQPPHGGGNQDPEGCGWAAQKQARLKTLPVCVYLSWHKAEIKATGAQTVLEFRQGKDPRPSRQGWNCGSPGQTSSDEATPLACCGPRALILRLSEQLTSPMGFSHLAR